jgi:hypothetical protein
VPLSLRLGVVSWLVMVVASLFPAGCKRDDGPPPTTITDASHDLPPRQVVSEIPDGFFERDAADAAPLSIGTTPITPSDGGAKDPDMKPPGSTDAGGDGPGGSCNLVQQNCSAGRGCYPAGGSNGNGACLPEGGFPEHMLCQEHSQCRRGYLCANAFDAQLCLPICEGGGPPCPDQRVCRVYPGSTIGTCSP